MGRIAGKSHPSFIFLHALSLAVLCASSAHPAYDDAPTFGVAVSDANREVEPAAVRREEHGGGRIIDISHYYREEMPAWESAEGVGRFLRLLQSMDNGSLVNSSEMMLPAHTGTHVDAPGHVFQHYFEAGFDVDTLDLEVLNGLTSFPLNLLLFFFRDCASAILINNDLDPQFVFFFFFSVIVRKEESFLYLNFVLCF